MQKLTYKLPSNLILSMIKFLSTHIKFLPYLFVMVAGKDMGVVKIEEKVENTTILKQLQRNLLALQRDKIIVVLKVYLVVSYTSINEHPYNIKRFLGSKQDYNSASSYEFPNNEGKWELYYINILMWLQSC